MRAKRSSKGVVVRCAVSSFFEICDRNLDCSPITDKLAVGARGGGFIIDKGSMTVASGQNSKAKDVVIINGRYERRARTTLAVIELIRKKFSIPTCEIHHEILPPIGMGFGTSGSGALGAAIAISDLFDLHMTLREAASYAHIAELESATGLGTVISLASGSGAVGVVTEPGSFGVGRVDSLIFDCKEYSLICGCFGTVSKSSVLFNERRRELVNRFGRVTLDRVMEEKTPEALLRYSRTFAEKTGLASKKLLKIADRAIEFGAIGASQNMIGNSLHCLVENKKKSKFLERFSPLVENSGVIFESNLSSSGPQFA
jgi:pantoate kinase